MTLEAYSYCPGGTGKRIKHCGCRDITGELDKIIRAIEGEQRIAALDRINRLLATHGHRPCLLALKIPTLLQMNSMQGLEEAVTTFTKVAPDNALAHSFAAILEARKHRVRAAVDELQTAMSLRSDATPGELADAYKVVAYELLEQGHYLAAVAHWELDAQLDPHDRGSKAALASLLGLEQVPLGLKGIVTFLPCPAEATWRGRFEATLRDARQGLWRKSLEKFEKLNQDFPHQPAVWWNIAVARALLALPTAAAAFRAYAACEGLPMQDAVRAETIAQFLAADDAPEKREVVRVTRPITDQQAVHERMLQSPCLVSLPREQFSQQHADEPPPRALFALLDRPAPANDVELTAANAPLLLTRVALFGKETDRPARLMYAAPQSDLYQAIPAALADVAGPRPPDTEDSREVIGQIDAAQAELFVECYRSPRTTVAQHAQLALGVLQERFRTRWRHLSQPALDGKTPTEVAQDPTYRIRLAATLEVLEQTAEVHGWEIDMDQLRRELHVPIPAPIDPTGRDLDTLPPTDWHRVMAARLTDEGLRACWLRAEAYAARRAALQFGAELLRRAPADMGELNLSDVCGRLAHRAFNSDQALEYLSKASRYAVAMGHSPAPSLLIELPLRFLRGETQEAFQVLRKLQQDHLREPGVAETLYHLLEQFGLVRQDLGPEARPEPAMAGIEAAPAAAVGTAERLASAAAPPPKPSKLWLPD